MEILSLQNRQDDGKKDAPHPPFLAFYLFPLYRPTIGSFTRASGGSTRHKYSCRKGAIYWLSPVIWTSTDQCFQCHFRHCVETPYYITLKMTFDQPIFRFWFILMSLSVFYIVLYPSFPNEYLKMAKTGSVGERQAKKEERFRNRKKKSLYDAC